MEPAGILETFDEPEGGGIPPLKDQLSHPRKKFLYVDIFGELKTLTKYYSFQTTLRSTSPKFCPNRFVLRKPEDNKK
jgi:hypothetical protein